MTLFTKIDGCFAFFMRYVLIFLMTAIPVICGLDVFFRYLLRSPLHGSDEILILLQIWLYFIGVASAARERSHITARVLEALFKTNESIAALRMAVALIGTGIAVYLLTLGWDYFEYAFRVAKTTAILNYPMFWYECAPFLCFIPLVIYTFVEFCFYLKRVRHCDLDLLHQNEEIDGILKELEETEAAAPRKEGDA